MMEELVNFQPITLRDDLLIGRGGVREVYQHPHLPECCIKIIYNKKKQRSANREIRYLRRYRRLGKPFDHLTRFHGLCRTNLGPGAVFDLVRDYDGGLSQPLSRHAQGEAVPCLSPAEIFEHLENLLRHLLDNEIISCDPAPHNLAVQYLTPEKARLVIIDGIGNPHFIKIADYSTVFAHRLIRKKWRYYVETNPLLEKAFTCRHLRDSFSTPSAKP